jgi:hypothetical protein
MDTDPPMIRPPRGPDCRTSRRDPEASPVRRRDRIAHNATLRRRSSPQPDAVERDRPAGSSGTAPSGRLRKSEEARRQAAAECCFQRSCLRPNGSQLAIRPSLVSAQPGCRAAVVGPVRVGREVGGREPACAVCPDGSLPVRDLVLSYVRALSQRIGNESALATSRPVPAIARFVLAPVVLADLVAGDLWFASELAIGLFPFFNLILRGFRALNQEDVMMENGMSRKRRQLSLRSRGSPGWVDAHGLVSLEVREHVAADRP